jgi:hypothetical protein
LGIEGGSPPYLVRLKKRRLPAGLAIDGGTITGVPSRRKTVTVLILVSDAKGNTVSAAFKLIVRKPPKPPKAPKPKKLKKPKVARNKHRTAAQSWRTAN